MLPDRKTTIVTVQDKFGFIQDVVKPEETENENNNTTNELSLIESRNSRNAQYEKREGSEVKTNSYGIPDKSLKIKFDTQRDAIRKRTLGRNEED